MKLPRSSSSSGQAAAVPGWLPLVTMALGIAGFAVSVYMTYEHYTGSKTLACPATGVVDCQSVTTSDQSELFGVPIVLPGMAYFVGMFVLCLPVFWRLQHWTVRWARLVGAVGGLAFVAWLIYAELFIIGKICLWCTAVHVITFAMFVAVIFGAALVTPDAAGVPEDVGDLDDDELAELERLAAAEDDDE